MLLEQLWPTWESGFFLAVHSIESAPLFAAFSDNPLHSCMSGHQLQHDHWGEST